MSSPRGWPQACYYHKLLIPDLYAVNLYFIAEKGHSVTGVYYSSASLHYANYHELIPDLYQVIILIVLQRRGTL
jgi:hypothetical protein